MDSIVRVYYANTVEAFVSAIIMINNARFRDYTEFERDKYDRPEHIDNSTQKVLLVDIEYKFYYSGDESPNIRRYCLNRSYNWDDTWNVNFKYYPEYHRDKNAYDSKTSTSITTLRGSSPCNSAAHIAWDSTKWSVKYSSEDPFVPAIVRVVDMHYKELMGLICAIPAEYYLAYKLIEKIMRSCEPWEYYICKLAEISEITDLLKELERIDNDVQI